MVYLMVHLMRIISATHPPTAESSFRESASYGDVSSTPNASLHGGTPYRTAPQAPNKSPYYLECDFRVAKISVQ